MEIDINNFEEEVLKSDKPVLLKFYASQGCGFCDKFTPIYKEFAKNHPEIKCVQSGRENLRMAPNELETKFDVKSFPLTLAFYKGKLIAKESGMLTEQALLEMTKTIETVSLDELLSNIYAINIEIAKKEKELFDSRTMRQRIMEEVTMRQACLEGCEDLCPKDDSSCYDKCKDICKHGRSCMVEEEKEELKEYLINKNGK